MSGYRDSGPWRAFERIATRIDQRRGWDTLPTPVALAVLTGVRNRLRKENLHDTRTAAGDAALPLPAWEERFRTQRTPDGSFNDLGDPRMGMAGSRFGRNVPVDATWPERAPELMTPDPREVSRRLLTRDAFVPATSVNALVAAWLQFMIRDWFNHGRTTTGEGWRIPLDEDDPFPENPLTVMPTPADPTAAGDDGTRPPTYVNHESHWWDGSSIYGSTLEQQRRVRTGQGGRLVVGRDGMLPVHADPERDPSQEPGFWTGLLMLHWLFTLEHNAICDHLAAAHPAWDDEELFQRARLVNAALLAKIHTVEWTPAVISHPTTVVGLRANWFGLAEERVHRLWGRISKEEAISGIPGSQTAHYGVPYSLTEEFVAVYRMHPLVPDDWSVRSLADDAEHATLTFRELTGPAGVDVTERFGMPDLFYSFGTEHPGLVTLHNFPRFLQEFERPDGRFMDLAATDVLRVRELGVPRYCEFRRRMHLTAPATFEELTDDPEWARQLRAVYDDVEQVDLVVGVYAEPRPKGFAFSDTAFRIFILMASRRLNSDRFFTEDYTPRVYSAEGLRWIDDNSMATVLLRHLPQLRSAMPESGNAFEPWSRAGRPAPSA